MSQTQELGRDQPVPAEYAGKWVAWDSKHERIIASAKTLEEVAAFYTNMFANVPDPVQLTAQDEADMVAYLKLLR